MVDLLLSFTFHNVSINTTLHKQSRVCESCFTFHNVSINTSESWVRSWIVDHTLHSIMFLLILYTTDIVVEEIEFFTFHNVSINTCGLDFKRTITINFTFHNVSINTEKVDDTYSALVSLHSIMFLLIPKR